MSSSLPAAVTNVLMLEVGGLCPVPRCSNDVWGFFPIEENKGATNAENLIGLCEVHFAMAKAHHLSQSMLTTIKNLLRGDRGSKGSGIFPLKSRAEYLSEASRQLFTTGDEFCATYVGPLPLHPDWYFHRRDQTTNLPNMDRPVREYLRAHRGSRIASVRLIFRNSIRYLDKLAETILPAERGQLVEDILREIENLWGSNGDRGPDLCCFDTGFFHIPLLYKQVAISSSRSGERKAIQEGILHTDPTYVSWEKRNFNSIFDSSYRGQQKELEALREFVKSLSP